MTKKLFTEREIQILSNNLYVKSVSQKGITYTEEFKHIFIEERGCCKAHKYPNMNA
ncbi:hypothetical protein [Bacillus thuringiensis]|uniref:hypothetical protein n=1 Tax=Bacillus thuringiensis TaxID=1428 RepID=UPI003B97FB58